MPTPHHPHSDRQCRRSTQQRRETKSNPRAEWVRHSAASASTTVLSMYFEKVCRSAKKDALARRIPHELALLVLGPVRNPPKQLTPQLEAETVSKSNSHWNVHEISSILRVASG